MKSLLYVGILACVILNAGLASAQLVVVSDIDDTIKVSHVLDPDSAVGNSSKVGNLFRGMPELYQQIRLHSPGVRFFYLSAAPEALMRRFHSAFLEKNSFPSGTLLLRRGLQGSTHKITSLRRIAAEQRPTQMILLGDNGEKDPEIYEQFQKEFPQISMRIYIREAYSSQHEESDDRGSRLRPGQTPFVTPMEIALDLKEKGFLVEAQVQSLETSYIPSTLQRAQDEDRDGETGILSFPNWQDCRDFVIPETLKRRNTQLFQSLVLRIQSRCSVPPFDD